MQKNIWLELVGKLYHVVANRRDAPARSSQPRELNKVHRINGVGCAKPVATISNAVQAAYSHHKIT